MIFFTRVSSSQSKTTKYELRFLQLCRWTMMVSREVTSHDSRLGLGSWSIIIHYSLVISHSWIVSGETDESHGLAHYERM